MNKKSYTLIVSIFILGGAFVLYGMKFAHQRGNESEQMKGSVFIIGDIRVQLLSDTLLRIEQRNSEGFEDRSTFTVVDRDWPGTLCQKKIVGEHTEIITANYTVVVHLSQGATGVQIRTFDGSLIYDYGKRKSDVSYLPEPGDKALAWIMPDSPRMIPPIWGATPAPSDFQDQPASGWDLQGNVVDDYVFILPKNNYGQFQKDFTKLTGSTPLPPLYAFGLWNSRYYAYTEDSALQAIEKYRQKQIPLDVFVLDTDWRTGAGIGYDINTDLFPDMHRFTKKVHDKNVFLVINDHPEAVGNSATELQELQYRYSNLSRLLDLGIDAWWYDRNWHAHLKAPLPGVSEEVWGMRLYHDITQQFRPQQRALILANVDGIDHGRWAYPSHPAAHRFPIWWTGDTLPEWEYLQSAIANGVNSGVFRAMPYVSEDIGGHYGVPTEEFYLRSIQYGVFSPILRLHSSGKTRYPWSFGSNTEKIATDYIQLRYRLLPLIYSAARQNYEKGVPLLRRCDLYWPEYKDAVNDQQYLLGDDLLVAPVNDGKGFHQIPDSLLHTTDKKQGLQGEYFENITVEGEPKLVRRDVNIDFDWGEGAGSAPAEGLPSDFFSIRWKGILGPVPLSGRYEFGLIADDGVRLWIDNMLVVDFWKDQGASLRTGTIKLEAGQTYLLRIEYYDRQFRASCKLVWWNRDDHTPQTRKLWIPPGSWQDLWTGQNFIGPMSVTLTSPLWHIPLFVRNGGIVLSVPQQQFTKQTPWLVVIADAFIASGDYSTTRILYEDDGETLDYQRNICRKTPMIMSYTGEQVTFRIGKSEGSIADNLKERTWIVRLHLPVGYNPKAVLVDGKTIPVNNNYHESSAGESASLLSRKMEKKSLFSGQGELPPIQGGPVLEVILTNRTIYKDTLINVTL